MAPNPSTAASRLHHEQPAKLDNLVTARASGDLPTCRRAEEAAVIAFLPIAARVAGRYRHRGVDFDDLEQVARIGLVKAVHRWRPERGAFLAYAMPTIEGEVKRHFRDGASTIRIPRQLYESQPRVTAAQQSLRQELCREPTATEIGDRTGMSEQQVRDVQSASATCQPLSSDDGSDTFEEFSSPEADRDLGMVMLRSRLRPALGVLSRRERHIIALRFIWGQSQMQIAHGLGVSQMQVSRALRAALLKIRDRITEDDTAAQ